MTASCYSSCAQPGRQVPSMASDAGVRLPGSGEISRREPWTETQVSRTAFGGSVSRACLPPEHVLPSHVPVQTRNAGVGCLYRAAVPRRHPPEIATYLPRIAHLLYLGDSVEQRGGTRDWFLVRLSLPWSRKGIRAHARNPVRARTLTGQVHRYQEGGSIGPRHSAAAATLSLALTGFLGVDFGQEGCRVADLGTLAGDHSFA